MSIDAAYDAADQSTKCTAFRDSYDAAFIPAVKPAIGSAFKSSIVPAIETAHWTAIVKTIDATVIAAI